MIRKLLTAGAVLAASALVLSGCSSSAPANEASGAADDSIRIAAFSAGYASPAIKYVIDSVQASAEGQGWEFDLTTTNDDYDALNSNVQAAIDQDYDAFFLAGFDPRALGLGIGAAKDAGIPVFAIDGDPQPNDQFTLDVVSDQQDLADLSIDGLEAGLGDLEGKRIVLISFDPSLTISTRAGLVEDGLTDAGAEIADIHKVSNIAASVDDSLAYVKDYLQAHPGEVDAIWGGWSPASIGAFQAVAESGQDVVVVSADTMGAVNEIIAGGGPFVATAMQDWDTAVEEVVGGMGDYFETGSVESNFLSVPGIYIDSTNAASVDPGY